MRDPGSSAQCFHAGYRRSAGAGDGLARSPRNRRTARPRQHGGRDPRRLCAAPGCGRGVGGELGLDDIAGVRVVEACQRLHEPPASRSRRPTCRSDPRPAHSRRDERVGLSPRRSRQPPGTPPRTEGAAPRPRVGAGQGRRTAESSAVHQDYEHVNDLLAGTEEVRTEFETQIVKIAARDVELLKHAVASFSITAAREAAWSAARSLWNDKKGVVPRVYSAHETGLGETAGTVSHGIRLPVAPDSPHNPVTGRMAGP
ncbi:DUF5995 family protein [Streptomyces tsukubensis]|uniref:DUF5995 family protein n=1 Tax=Streptomyces tsukubensis TaxID=83656 RepID=UPI001D04060B